MAFGGRISHAGFSYRNAGIGAHRCCNLFFEDPLRMDMDMETAATRDTQAVRQTQGSPRKERQIPAMRVVTKGWWTLKEEREPVEKLEEADRNQRRQD